jgi:hypothetical protein
MMLCRRRGWIDPSGTQAVRLVAGVAIVGMVAAQGAYLFYNIHANDQPEPSNKPPQPPTVFQPNNACLVPPNFFSQDPASLSTSQYQSLPQSLPTVKPVEIELGEPDKNEEERQGQQRTQPYTELPIEQDPNAESEAQ